MDRRTAGVYGALCGGLLGLMVIAACSQPVTGDPEDVSPDQPETSVTGTGPAETGGDTTIPIPTVVPPTQDSKPTSTVTTPQETREPSSTTPSTSPPPERDTFTTVPPPPVS
jgi:hypothetical protein